ncbi:MAG: M14 family metallopeptidase [Armatimonadota bacterium]
MAELPSPRYDAWYTYAELTEHLRTTADARPDLCSLRSLGQSPEGREIWMLEVADRSGGPTEQRPAFLVHANIHAKEVAGTNSSLCLVHELLSGAPDYLDSASLLREVTFYVVPRLNPDGAEFALSTGADIRSRTEEWIEPNCLVRQDLDGDGAIVDMRIERPDGTMKALAEDPRVMVRREATDTEGPFYVVYPEGVVHEWDGGEVRLSCGRSHDFNRNWPANWHQEHEQGGAGDFPFSEPEMRALADFVYAHPGIFAILGFHCGSSAVLMPPSTGSLDSIIPADRKVFEELGQRAAELTGLKLLPTIDYRSADQPPAELRGHSADWGYLHMGLFHFEIEQGNIFNAAGVSTQDFFAAPADERDRFLLDAIRYHDEHPEQAMFVDWHEFDHPQFGRVEIGGWKKYWMINPSFADLRERIAPGSARFIIEYAARRPRLVISEARAEALGGGVHRVRARVMNDGALPTNISARALVLRSLRPVTVELLVGPGVELLSLGRQRQIGHLGPRRQSAELEWFVRAERGGQVTVRATSQKAGSAERAVQLNG